MSITRFWPDTCGCVFDVADWGGDTIDYLAPLSLWQPPRATTLKVCPLHLGLSGSRHGVAVINGENRVRQYSMTDIKTTVEDLFWTEKDARTRNLSRLFDFLGDRRTPRLEESIHAFNDAELEEELKKYGLTAIEPWMPLPGVTWDLRFADDDPIGSSRRIGIAFRQLIQSERQTVEQRHARYGDQKVTLR